VLLICSGKLQCNIEPLKPKNRSDNDIAETFAKGKRRTDKVKFFFTVDTPRAVTAGEFILILLGIGYMLYGQRIYIENLPNTSSNLASKEKKTA
jgi:hypothetical protein